MQQELHHQETKITEEELKQRKSKAVNAWLVGLEYFAPYPLRFPWCYKCTCMCGVRRSAAGEATQQPLSKCRKPM
jgi:hypothetical protein